MMTYDVWRMTYDECIDDFFYLQRFYNTTRSEYFLSHLLSIMPSETLSITVLKSQNSLFENYIIMMSVGYAGVKIDSAYPNGTTKIHFPQAFSQAAGIRSFNDVLLGPDSN